jgi:hypothetical protein
MIISDKYKIVEGIAGMWHYHLAEKDSNGTKSLCGKWTMPTHSSLDSWGFMPTHMPTNYCQKCEELANINNNE